MPDEFFTQNPTPQFSAPQYPGPVRSPGGGRAIVAAALLAFVAMGGAIGYFAWTGTLPFGQPRGGPGSGPARIPLVFAPAATAPASPSAETLARADALDARMAALEDRKSVV